MPGHAKNSFKKDQVAKDKAEKASASIQEAGTEQEKMQAMFQVLSGAWSAEREDLSQYVPLFILFHRSAVVPFASEMGLTMSAVRNRSSSTNQEPTGRPTSRITNPRMATSAIGAERRVTGSRCAPRTTTRNTTTDAA